MSLGPGPLHSMAYASAPPPMGRKPGMISLDKITQQSQSSIVPYNHLAFLAVAKMIQAGSAHFLREWIWVDQHSHQPHPFLITLFWLLAMGALVSLAIEHPWSRKGRRSFTASKDWDWSKLVVYAAALAGQMYLFLWGLWALPTFRVLMLTQYANIWMVAVLAALAGKRSSSSSTKQYSFVVLGGILACFIADVYMRPASTSLFTVCSGYVALLVATQLSTYQRGVSRRLSTKMGDYKVLNAVALAVAAALVSPIALLQYTLGPSSSASIASSSTAPGWITFLLLGVGLFVVDFYVNQSISHRVSPMWHVVTGWPIVLGSSCFTGLLVSKVLGANLVDVILAIVILYGIHELLQADAAFAEARLDPEEGLQRYHYMTDSYDRHGSMRNGMAAHANSTNGGSGLGDVAMYVRVILADQDSKQIFYFLLLNLSFMFVQMLYGVWTNSLGLISDSIHMFFDCLALAVGLFASVMSKWDANRTFSYGYSRVETLSGFSNGIFLCLISIFIVIEAIERLVHPPEMNTHRLLLVSFLGFVVNMIGIFAFNHGHAHGHGHGHGHGHDHHHHHHHGHGHDHGHNANMQGVFLHIMADTLGSVGVIISTLLIDWFGWTGFDPIASMFIAVLIFLSVIPLIKDSAATLMLEVPEGRLGSIEHALEELHHIAGVSSFKAARFWPNSPETLIGSIHIVAAESERGEHHATSSLEQIRQAVEQALLGSISGLSEVTVQVERASSGLPMADQQQHHHHHHHGAECHGHNTSHNHHEQQQLQSLQYQHVHEDYSQHVHHSHIHNHNHNHTHSHHHHQHSDYQIKSL